MTTNLVFQQAGGDSLEVAARSAGGRVSVRGKSAIWVVANYPETEETSERLAAAEALHVLTGLPIWVFGSSLPRYGGSVEEALKRELVKRGVNPDVVLCSADLGGGDSLDTVQEAFNVAATARRFGVETLFCVSNNLQLLQVRLLLRREALTILYLPTPLRDRRWWYVSARLIVIPLAFFGVGRNFWPLRLLRRARARLPWWAL